jgi:hypothetical protein
MTTADIVKATQGKPSTPQNRLSRLHEKCLVARGEGGAGTATLTQDLVDGELTLFGSYEPRVKPIRLYEGRTETSKPM